MSGDSTARRRVTLRSVAQTASAAVILIGAAALLGWWLGVEPLKRGLPGGVAMNPATALSFILAGACLWLVRAEPVSRPARRLAAALAATVALIGLLRLGGYLFGAEVGIDQLLFRERLVDLVTGRPSRMAPNTALCFLLLAAALLTLNRRTRRGRWPAQYFAVAATVIAALPLLGYAYGVSSLTGVAAFIPMALNTALAFLALSAGVLSARADRGLLAAVWGTRPSVRGQVNVGFGVALLILVLTGGVSLWSNLRSSASARERRASFIRRSEIEHLFDNVVDAETGQRGYLLTGDVKFLKPYTRALDSLPARLGRVRALVREHPSQAARLAALEPLIRDKMAELEQTNALRRERRAPEALRIVQSGRGHRLMDSIRDAVAAMVQEENALVADWDARLGAADRVSIVTNVAAGLFAVVFLLAAALVINRDMSKREHAEAALRESESRLFQILEALPVAVFVVDAAGRPYYANQVSQEILGKGIVPDAAPDQIGQVYQAYVAGTDQPYPSGRIPVVRALAGERVHATDLEIHRPDRVVPVEVWAAPVLDAQGRSAFAIAAFSDVTERKRAEDEVRRARDAAEAANRAKSDFLAKMSHELRTPLNSIIGFSEVLEDGTFGPLNDKQRRYVTNVLTSGRQLLQLINDILDLSKVEAGRMELALSEFDPAAALHEVRTIVAALAQQKHLVLEVEVSEALPRLTADQTKFKQILYNLLSNAIKFTPDGGRVRVTAGLAPDGEAEGGLEIAVADTGIGLSPEDRERIFGEFEQIDTAYGRLQQGTGLGLALTRKLVELHGGRIRVESEPGHGSTFTFLLPLAAGTPLPAQPSVEAAAAAGPQGTGPLVLVVDDDRPAAELLAHYLTEAGYQVAQAATGDQALALARELRPAVITLDIVLRGGDGLAVLAQLKAAPETRDIPVVVVSITEGRELGLSMGAVDWFVKPVNRDTLVAAVRRAASGAAAAGTPTVLVVDDEPATVELLTEMLTTAGFRVLAAHGGREGIALALAERPDVLVLDLVMPEVTGFDVVRELRARRETRELPILIFTGKDLTLEERDRLRGSAQAIVAKGGREELLRELARVRSGWSRSPGEGAAP